MIGMDYFYADQQAQSPSDEENAIAICRLVEDGYVNAILMSQDVFFKMMLDPLRRLRLRLHPQALCSASEASRHDQATIDHMLIENPRRVFSAAHRAL